MDTYRQPEQPQAVAALTNVDVPHLPSPTGRGGHGTGWAGGRGPFVLAILIFFVTGNANQEGIYGGREVWYSLPDRNCTKNCDHEMEMQGRRSGWVEACECKTRCEYNASYITTEPRANPMPTPVSPPINHIVVRVVLPHFTESPER